MYPCETFNTLSWFNTIPVSSRTKKIGADGHRNLCFHVVMYVKNASGHMHELKPYDPETSLRQKRHYR